MTDVYTLPLYLKLDEYEKYVFEERAAIREYEGEYDRDSAELAALRDMMLIRRGVCD